MAPICINSGSMFKVDMSLRSVMLLVSIVLLSTILTVIAFGSQRSSKNELCSQYGISESKDYTGILILSVLATVMGILSISATYRTATTSRNKIWSWILPISYIGLTALFIVLAVLLAPKEVETGTIADSVVAQWCQEHKNDLKGLGIASGVVLGLVTGGVLSFMSLVLAKRCIL